MLIVCIVWSDYKLQDAQEMIKCTKLQLDEASVHEWSFVKKQNLRNWPDSESRKPDD
jgi:hypothetical protein